MRKTLLWILFAAVLGAFSESPWLPQLPSLVVKRNIGLAFGQIALPFPGPGGVAAPPANPLAPVGSNSAVSNAVSYSPTAGNLVRVWIVAYGGNSPLITSVTDNATGGSTSYSSAFNTASPGGNSNLQEAEFYTCSVKAGVTTLTVNASPYPNGYMMAIVQEWSGNATSSCLDKVPAGYSYTASSVYSNYSGTLSQAFEVAIGDFFNSSCTTAFVGTSGFGGTINLVNSPWGKNSRPVSKVVSVTSSLQATASGGCGWDAWIVTYKAS
jgi:hypothetical protein